MLGEKINLPKEDLKGYAPEDFVCFKVDCNDMFPLCREGDKILVNTRILPDKEIAKLYVVYINGECVLRYVTYTDNGLHLSSCNPYIPDTYFENEDVDNIMLVGAVTLLSRSFDFAEAKELTE